MALLALTLPLMMSGVAGAGATEHLRFPSVVSVRHSVLSLVDLLTGRPAPVPALPEQESGTAAGKAHSVPAAVTRAVAKATGHKPGKGRGQEPAYSAHGVTAGKFTTGPAVHGFNPTTSTLVRSATTATTDLYKNADGSYTRKVFEGPVNYRTSSGAWAPIDTSLVPTAAGRWQEAANSVSASFAAHANDPALVVLTGSGDDGFSFSLAGAAPASGSAKGSSITYAGVLPFTDLTETATVGGSSEALVLSSASAPSAWLFPLRLSGLRAVPQPDGDVFLDNSSGTTVWVIPQATATDGRINPRTGLPVSSTHLTYRLVSYRGGLALEMTLDRSWLDAPGRDFPVTVDPDYWVNTSTYVRADDTSDNADSEFLQAGYDDTTVARSFLDFSSEIRDDQENLHITAASLHIFDEHAWQCSDTEDLDLYQITSSWTAADLTSWSDLPTVGDEISTWSGAAPSAACSAGSDDALASAGGWLTMTLNSDGLDLMNDWSLGRTTAYGFELRGYDTSGNESDDYDWKLFDSANDGDVTSESYDGTTYSDCTGNCEPYLEITSEDDEAPQINSQYPPDNYNSPSLTPELLASGSDPDDWPDGGVDYYQFTVYTSSGTQVATSGHVTSPDWTVPAGDLSWGQTYYWIVQDFDGLDWSSTVTTSYFSTPVPQPLITSGLSQNDTGPGFDAASGDWTTSATDANITTVGPALEITRDYNSEDPRSSEAFGAGWSSVLDMKVSPGQTDSSGATATEVVTYPDGEQVGFGLTSTAGVYAPPPGRYATLRAVTGGFTLTDKNDTIYTFTESLGSDVYGITSIADSLGHTETFTWSDNEITTVTSASGRALTITWTSSGHVASVVTPDATTGDASTALTWTYSYSGNELTTVCPPTSTTACTAYTYTSGSDYPAAVLDSGPHSYWRLDDTSGTTADSSVLLNEGTDNATYSSGVGLDSVASPLTGSSATAASFDGSSAYVTLPTSLVSGAQYQSVSLWFKTSSDNEVLFSYSDDKITAGTTTGGYTPTLYVGSDGKLYGEFWTGSVEPIVSTSAVNNGQWHQVTLTAAGDTQIMYLDGAKVGSLSGTIDVTKEDYDYVGAGFTGGLWPEESYYNTSSNTGTASYFDGDISDVAFWDRPVTSAEVSAMYTADTQAAGLLTQVTRPSGSVYAQVTYDPLTNRVDTVTDSNGGTWTLHAPAMSGSSQVYVSSVLGAQPEDYWRLGDDGTTDAVNQVLGGTATYNDVTQGVSGGPFSDTTVDSLNGTDSYITAPSLVTSSGEETLSLWFKAPKTTTGEVLFSSSATALPTATTTTDYDAELYVGSDGHLYAEFWNGSVDPMESTSVVDDGDWHNVVLAAGTSSQSLYVDGAEDASSSGTVALQNSAQINDYLGGGYIGGSWPEESHYTTSSNEGYASYFTGDLAEVAWYGSQLSASQVADQWNASKYSSGLTPVQTTTVTDPGGNTLTYKYDALNGNRVLSQTDGNGDTTSYGYDVNGFQDEVVNPDGDVTETGYDVRGNMVSETTCQDQAADDCSTAYYTYYPDDTSSTLTADPRNDMVLTYRDPRSSSDTDATYETTYAYNSSGDVTAVTTPPVAGSPDGRETTYLYTDGTDDTGGYDQAIPPAGLPYQVTTPGGAVTTTLYFSDGDVAEVTDPDKLQTFYAYDGLGQVTTETVYSDSYPNGLTTTYTYNGDGQVTTETDPPVTNRVTGATHTAQTTNSYDADGDLLSQTVADTTGGDSSRTVSYAYNSNDLLESQTDASGAETTYTYNAYGDLASETNPAGNVTDYTYDADGNLLTTTLENYTGSPSGSQAAAPLVESSRAYDPAGRLASVTDSMGRVTSYGYTDDGLLATTTRYPDTADAEAGTSRYVTESNTYDAAGNLTAQVTNNGATTTDYTVDAADRTTEQVLDPSGLDRTTSVSYTPDDQEATVTQSGTDGDTRTTSYTYDPAGNMTSESVQSDGSGHPTGWWKLNQSSGSTVTDSSGTGNTAAATGVTWSGGAASLSGTSGQGITTNGPVLDTTDSFSVSAWVELPSTPSANTAVVTQAGSNTASFWLLYSASKGEWEFDTHSADSTSATVYPAYGSLPSGTSLTGTWTHLVGVYNATTETETLYIDGTDAGSTSGVSIFSATGPLQIGEGLYGGSEGSYLDGSVDNVQVYPRALSASDVTKLYDAGRTGGTTASSTADTTTWTLDERGLPTSMTDPDGNTTYYSYDEAGRLAETTEPSEPVETYTAAGGDTTVTADPETLTGYDTFGDTTETENADGGVTTYGYDADGRETSETLPSYTPPGSSSAITASYSKTYNDLGEVSSATDALGNETSYGYDQLGDLTGETTPAGTTSWTYDTNGDQLSETTPTGAETAATYDFLGRQLTSTQVERDTASGTTADYTTDYTYGTGGYLWKSVTPDGVTTLRGYDAAGELTSVEDGAGNTTDYGYDDLGQQDKVTYPDGTATETGYDALGDVTSVADLDSDGDTLRSESATYDGDGNELSATGYRGYTTSYTYNPDGTTATEVQPVTSSSSITTSFGYDADGNETRYTDGNGNDRYYTYNPWGLEESEVEPSTSQYSSVADSTTTYAYDADGRPATETEPGGVTITDGYNDVSELTSESGTGASSAETPTRTFGYDADGDLTSASTSNTASASSASNATSEAWTYDDRGDVLTSSGSAGSTSYTYNGDDLVSSVDDAAGTTSYTYDGDDRLSTIDDPATSTTASYSYNDDSQVSEISYGSDAQYYDYDDLHELTSDRLETSAGSTVASVSYGYDPDGDITSMDTTGLAGAADNTYTYDEADRLASWDNGSATTDYGYDADGNLTTDGSKTYTYDARDELTSDGTDTYSYAANGDLASETSSTGTEDSSFDAYGEQVTSGTQTYGYDALGRVITDTGSTSTSPSYTFSYQGTSTTLASDGTNTYTWDPSGTTLTGIGSSGGTSDGVLALTDQHGDVVADFTADSTSVTGSTAYDPWGDVTATSGTVSGDVGYQSEWTDPATGKVSMGARWYTPSAGGFTSADTAQVNPVPDSAAANPYAYAGDNPVNATDPTGHDMFLLRDGVGEATGTHIGEIITPSQSQVLYDQNQENYYQQETDSWSPPKESSCSWYDVSCDVKHVYNDALRLYHKAESYAVHYADLVKQLTERLAQSGVRDLDDAVSDAAKWGSHAAGAVWHAAESATARTYHAVTTYAAQVAHDAEHVVSTAWHHVQQAASATVTFIKHHAATIASVVTSVAVFAGCEATLGTVTGGAATTVCGGLAGAAGSAVGYAVTAVQNHDFSWSGLGDAALTGAVAGAAFAGLGELAGAGLGLLASGAADAVGALADSAAGEVGAEGAADAAGESGGEASESSEGSGSGASGDSCTVGGQSFTAGTKVLLASGKSEAISKLTVGQKVLATSTKTGKNQAETVTAVLV
ncbi:MAG: LamG-like jellyroll fold domain-containing protein, partial [Streptosporangiaceae bacterium]